jgi:hypothetical protein
VGVSSNREAVKVSVPTQPSLSGNEGMRANDRGRELLLFLGWDGGRGEHVRSAFILFSMPVLLFSWPRGNERGSVKGEKRDGPYSSSSVPPRPPLFASSLFWYWTFFMQQSGQRGQQLQQTHFSACLSVWVHASARCPGPSNPASLHHRHTHTHIKHIIQETYSRWTIAQLNKWASFPFVPFSPASIAHHCFDTHSLTQ